MKTHKFARKTFYVDAVRVSEANINEVAEWCGGTIKEDETGHAFLSVEVNRPLTERQTQAFIGDWVLFAGTGYKVYTPKAFDKSFEKVKTLTKEQADAAGITVPHEKRQPNNPRPTAPKRKGKVGSVGKALIDAQKKDETDVDYRSAKTGQYVSEETAEANPDTTVKETHEIIRADERGPEGYEPGEVVDVVEKKTKADVEADKLINEVLGKK